MMKILHAKMLFLTFSIYPGFPIHILIVMIFRHFPPFDVYFVATFKMMSC